MLHSSLLKSVCACCDVISMNESASGWISLPKFFVVSLLKFTYFTLVTDTLINMTPWFNNDMTASEFANATNFANIYRGVR